MLINPTPVECINVRVTEYVVPYSVQITIQSCSLNLWKFQTTTYETIPNSPPPRLLIRLLHAPLGIFLVDPRQPLAILRDIRFGKKKIYSFVCGGDAPILFQG